MSSPCSPPLFIPIAGLCSESSSIDICRAIADLHTFHQHRKFFNSKRWDKQYDCIIRFSADRQYSRGGLAVAYLHYRLRTLYRLCGEGSPHPDERSIERRRTITVGKRQRQLAAQNSNSIAHQDDPPHSSNSAISHIGPSPQFSLHLLSALPTLSVPTANPALPPPSLAMIPSLPALPTPPAMSCYHSAHPETQALTSLFTLYTQKCGPSHGADFDMCNLPEKRSRRTPSASGLASLPQPDHSVPESVSAGYAECTLHSFDKVCEWLCEKAPADLRMGPDSVFLDVGSGYGRCVVQARLRANARKSVGIEYVYVRYLMGVKMLMESIPSQFASLHARLGDSVELLHGDATDERFLEQYRMATHIFMFDWVFNAVGKEGVAKLIDQASHLRVLISCQRPTALPRFRRLHQMQLSTGKQHPTVYFYARAHQE